MDQSVVYVDGMGEGDSGTNSDSEDQRHGGAAAINGVEFCFRGGGDD